MKKIQNVQISIYVLMLKKLTELLKYNEVEGTMFKIIENPRVTKVGRFI